MRDTVNRRRRLLQLFALTTLFVAGAVVAFSASGTAAPWSGQQTTTSSSSTTTGSTSSTTTGTTTTTSSTTSTTTPTTTSTTTTTTAATPPVNTSPPTISGSAVEGQTLTANPGTWTGSQPMTFSYQFQRCDTAGAGCANIIGATNPSYQLTASDVGRTIRVIVTATNAGGSRSATSGPTGVVQAAGPAGQIRLANGRVSIPASSVALPARLIIDGVRFTPNPVRSRGSNIRIRVHVSDTRGFVVRGALVFVRSTPLLTTTAPEQATGTDGFVTFVVRPRAEFPLRRGINVQFFVRARKAGDNVLAGVSTRRLVQVRTAPPG